MVSAALYKSHSVLDCLCMLSLATEIQLRDVSNSQNDLHC